MCETYPSVLGHHTMIASWLIFGDLCDRIECEGQPLEAIIIGILVVLMGFLVLRWLLGRVK